MMQLIRKVTRPRRGPLTWGTPGQDAGFAMIVVFGYGMLIVLIMSLLAGYALSSMKGARREQDFTAAVAAAQAGVDNVIAKLRDGASAGSADWAAVPGSLDSTGAKCDLTPGTVPVNCPQYKYQTAELPNGDREIYAVGKTRDNVQRALKVTVHKSNFTDYLYYSEVEAADPADGFAYPRLLNLGGAPAGCEKRAWPASNARPPGCKVPTWRNGDKTDKSRVHTNDVFQTVGTPEFNSLVTTAYDQCKPAPATTPVCFLPKPGSVPDFKKGKPSYSTGLELNVAAPVDLLAKADPARALAAGETHGCIYTGPTRIRFAGDQMYVWSPQSAPVAGCGGGLTSEISAALLLAFPGVSLSAQLSAPLDQLLLAGLPVAFQPAPVPIPKNNVIYVKNNPVPQNGIYCLLGKVLGLTGSLDTNVTQGNCQAGNLFVSGNFDGRLTIGADGDALIMTDLRYSDASGSTYAHDGSDSLGIVALGAVEVYNPVQCLLAAMTCLSLNDLPAVLPGHSVQVDAAVMSLQHRFGTQLPILQPDVYASLLNGLVPLNLPTPSIKLYGSIAQKFRGILGADVLGVSVTVDNVDVASANVNIGYKADYTYDQNLRNSPPPYFPKPLSVSWEQDTFAEIPVSDLPAGMI